MSSGRARVAEFRALSRKRANVEDINVKRVWQCALSILTGYSAVRLMAHDLYNLTPFPSTRPLGDDRLVEANPPKPDGRLKRSMEATEGMISSASHPSPGRSSESDRSHVDVGSLELQNFGTRSQIWFWRSLEVQRLNVLLNVGKTAFEYPLILHEAEMDWWMYTFQGIVETKRISMFSGLTIEIQRAKDNVMIALPSNDLCETSIHLSNSSKSSIN
uniref:Uncharacterized protein n=1 Tax=Vespula pensylvanica TaxID=30213 RepID=A0A834U8Y7_VESPE|nr:hypothetical protein H0235_009877 [Vespula pensylvanica]